MISVHFVCVLTDLFHCTILIHEWRIFSLWYIVYLKLTEHFHYGILYLSLTLLDIGIPVILILGSGDPMVGNIGLCADDFLAGFGRWTVVSTLWSTAAADPITNCGKMTGSLGWQPCCVTIPLCILPTDAVWLLSVRDPVRFIAEWPTREKSWTNGSLLVGLFNFPNFFFDLLASCRLVCTLMPSTGQTLWPFLNHSSIHCLWN